MTDVVSQTLSTRVNENESSEQVILKEVDSIRGIGLGFIVDPSSTWHP